MSVGDVSGSGNGNIGFERSWKGWVADKVLSVICFWKPYESNANEIIATLANSSPVSTLQNSQQLDLMHKVQSGYLKVIKGDHSVSRKEGEEAVFELAKPKGNAAGIQLKRSYSGGWWANAGSKILSAISFLGSKEPKKPISENVKMEDWANLSDKGKIQLLHRVRAGYFSVTQSGGKLASDKAEEAVFTLIKSANKDQSSGKSGRLKGRDSVGEAAEKKIDASIDEDALSSELPLDDSTDWTEDVVPASQSFRSSGDYDDVYEPFEDVKTPETLEKDANKPRSVKGSEDLTTQNTSISISSPLSDLGDRVRDMSEHVADGISSLMPKNHYIKVEDDENEENQKKVSSEPGRKPSEQAEVINPMAGLQGIPLLNQRIEAPSAKDLPVSEGKAEGRGVFKMVKQWFNGPSLLGSSQERFSESPKPKDSSETEGGRDSYNHAVEHPVEGGGIRKRVGDAVRGAKEDAGRLVQGPANYQKLGEQKEGHSLANNKILSKQSQEEYTPVQTPLPHTLTEKSQELVLDDKLGELPKNPKSNKYNFLSGTTLGKVFTPGKYKKLSEEDSEGDESSSRSSSADISETDRTSSGESTTYNPLHKTEDSKQEKGKEKKSWLDGK